MPMFKIVGIDGDSNFETEVVVDSPTEKDAKFLADSMGIKATSIVELNKNGVPVVAASNQQTHTLPANATKNEPVEMERYGKIKQYSWALNFIGFICYCCAIIMLGITVFLLLDKDVNGRVFINIGGENTKVLEICIFIILFLSLNGFLLQVSSELLIAFRDIAVNSWREKANS